MDNSSVNFVEKRPSPWYDANAKANIIHRVIMEVDRSHKAAVIRDAMELPCVHHRAFNIEE